ncbi:SUMF1/EgtB/PvdO family nonheme iron enzyme [Micromonospora sp. WMMD1102]|uniref:SUMF1/EgtB/PvdO family nonheme iron enzyme n=1 Tax=Micromonospora sp. WMMD1102 TaxID=3016105 RepID=UPI00241520CF|nr:SUMF1/EgtB/PvdO family nonheme iron enzyme [Micromonospora sp. WMMD1102]MDG4787994.1 SUMF1/EgtB/PvdO family nonheme iron enzyme [Micromonospora sp. WMMD1102]
MGRRVAFTAASNGPAGPNQLRYALTDQARLTRILGSRICGFDVSGTSATSSVAELRDGIFAVAEQCRPGDTLVVTFAGHALIDGGELFLLWHDSHPERLLRTALPARDVFAAMDRSRATNKLLVLDCCHAGAVLGPGFRAAPATSLNEVAAQAGSFLMLLASDRLERAREVESLSGGFLTVKLCQALERGADSDQDGQTSLGDAVEWIRRQAERHNAYSLGETVPIPLVLGKERGPVILTTAPVWEPWTFRLGSVEMVLLPVLYGFADAGAVAISRHPVTNDQYREFVTAADAGGQDAVEPAGYSYDPARMSWHEPFRPWDDRRYRAADLPVVCVDYRAAERYCGWLSRRFGGWDPRQRPSDGVVLSRSVDPAYAITLPTPAQWSFAAYGDFEALSPRSASGRTRRMPVRLQPEIHQDAAMPAAAERDGSRTNSLGVSDMFGNVWEWCLGAPLRGHRSTLVAIGDFDDELADRGLARTVELRGGGYLDEAANVVPYVRASELQYGLETAHTDLGFRVCTTVEVASLPDQVAEILTYHGVPLPDDSRTFLRLPTGQ